jgi:hypothetical protein
VYCVLYGYTVFYVSDAVSQMPLTDDVIAIEFDEFPLIYYIFSEIQGTIVK